MTTTTHTFLADYLPQHYPSPLHLQNAFFILIGTEATATADSLIQRQSTSPPLPKSYTCTSPSMRAPSINPAPAHGRAGASSPPTAYSEAAQEDVGGMQGDCIATLSMPERLKRRRGHIPEPWLPLYTDEDRAAHSGRPSGRYVGQHHRHSAASKEHQLFLPEGRGPTRYKHIRLSSGFSSIPHLPRSDVPPPQADRRRREAPCSPSPSPPSNSIPRPQHHQPTTALSPKGGEAPRRRWWHVPDTEPTGAGPIANPPASRDMTASFALFATRAASLQTTFRSSYPTLPQQTGSAGKAGNSILMVDVETIQFPARRGRQYPSRKRKIQKK
ncbi:hypothetical protein R3P38DRAFT_3223313 [Favolaschia claudopus]|uniref:Uncharacterized protein n=1 Tax=Favolaschia claudopus TaxID=2862362 RepID=A0AAV9ZX54_9AGAR